MVLSFDFIIKLVYSVVQIKKILKMQRTRKCGHWLVVMAFQNIMMAFLNLFGSAFSFCLFDNQSNSFYAIKHKNI